jgi:hypothetical protein
MVFVFAIVSCEQLWAQEIAEDQIVRNPWIFQEERAAAPRTHRGCCSTGAAYGDIIFIRAIGSRARTCALGAAQFSQKTIFQEL